MVRGLQVVVFYNAVLIYFIFPGGVINIVEIIGGRDITFYDENILTKITKNQQNCNINTL